MSKILCGTYGKMAASYLLFCVVIVVYFIHQTNQNKSPRSKRDLVHDPAAHDQLNYVMEKHEKHNHIGNIENKDRVLISAMEDNIKSQYPEFDIVDKTLNGDKQFNANVHVHEEPHADSDLAADKRQTNKKLHHPSIDNLKQSMKNLNEKLFDKPMIEQHIHEHIVISNITTHTLPDTSNSHVPPKLKENSFPKPPIGSIVNQLAEKIQGISNEWQTISHDNPKLNHEQSANSGNSYQIAAPVIHNPPLVVQHQFPLNGQPIPAHIVNMVNQQHPFLSQYAPNPCDDRDVINVYNLYADAPLLSAHSACVPLSTLGGSKTICVQDDIAIDQIIAKEIKINGIYEKEETDVFQMILESDPELNVIDIGGNIGLYTILAAAMGRKVVTIEPLHINVKHLHNSIRVNDFQQNVTVIMNAVSDIRETKHFCHYNGNPGSARILGPNDSHLAFVCHPADTVKSIHIDDMVQLIPFNKAVLKIDIEGHEVNALSQAQTLFEKVDIRFIFIEWAIIQSNPHLNNLVDYFVELGFTPFSYKLKPLSLHGYQTGWPINVIWVREDVK